MLRRRRDGWSDWCVAHVLFPVYVILLVCLLANAVGVATTDRKTRRKSLASSLSPAVDDVISDDVDSLPPDFDLTTQRPLSNVTSSSLVVTSSRRHRGGGGDRSFEFVNPRPADLRIECHPLKSKRYITDGFCTSIRPVVDFVCTGTCLPIRQLPWYAEFIKVWSHTKTLQYRCVDDVVRHRKVTFACDNGETRSYRIRVVRSCKCKRYVRSQNESPSVAAGHHHVSAAARHGGGGKRRRDQKKKRNNSSPPLTSVGDDDDEFDADEDDGDEDIDDGYW
jgi:hypothetical protein